LGGGKGLGGSRAEDGHSCVSRLFAPEPPNAFETHLQNARSSPPTHTKVECADFVLLNKTDLAPGGPDGDGIAQLGAIVASLNPLATVVACQHGKVRTPPRRAAPAPYPRACRAASFAPAARPVNFKPGRLDPARPRPALAPPCPPKVDLERVFGSSVHRVVAHLNTEGQHRGAVAAARAAAADEPGGPRGHGHGGEAGGSGHDHAHGEEGCGACAAEATAAAGPPHGADGHECGAACGEGGHGHGHGHGAHVGHGHSHGSHDHGGHGHGHGHSHGHGHGHGHKHKERAETRAAKRFGIRSFVYNRRRPFHPQRCAACGKGLSRRAQGPWQAERRGARFHIAPAPRRLALRATAPRARPDPTPHQTTGCASSCCGGCRSATTARCPPARRPRRATRP
jgi:hypothetical protein